MLQKNQFYIWGNKTEKSVLKNEDDVIWIGDDINSFKETLKKLLTSNDRIYIHWYDMFVGNFIQSLKINAPLINVHWGGEMFEDPYLFHAKRNYLPKTYQFSLNHEREFIYRNLQQKKLPKFPFYYFFLWRLKFKIKKQFKKKRKQVQLLSQSIQSPSNTGDIRLMKHIYCHPNLKDTPGFYDLNFDIAKNSNLNKSFSIENRKINILLNNAAHLSGNHLDAINKLKNLNYKNYHFYCPLSYGGTSNLIQVIIEEGKKNLEESFHPITHFIPRREYVDFLETIDVLFMYQNISQGFGNIVAALTQGKPVFLRKQNTLTELLNNIGIKVYDADAISHETIVESIKEARSSAEKNIKSLSENFSKETRLKFLKESLQ